MAKKSPKIIAVKNILYLKKIQQLNFFPPQQYNQGKPFLELK